jgi:hypothetical protein
MAWSYRNDSSDEMYSKAAGGPSAVEAVRLPRSPADGEKVENVINPPPPDEVEAPPQPEVVEGPAPPPTEEERQKAIDEARKASPKEEPAKPVVNKKMPAPPPTAEEQQKAIDAARGAEKETAKQEEAEQAYLKKQMAKK